ncbi:hypothetical protein [Paracidovorax wautersii]|uniref:Uncharacterized protein n=1 Tax=Paracidovorax wautersii TaxID=1177982 RepID=A0A1I2HSG6_9BURK|nr:hypothetical protein [Paracidovorax wautersii]SFF31646.1 hypothetical protein SAMN04489711_12714 [Paracidovorax wautersii]
MNWFSKKDAVQGAGIDLMLTASGVFINRTGPDGRFDSTHVGLMRVSEGDPQPTAAGQWAVGRAIGLEIKPEHDGTFSVVLRYPGDALEPEYSVYRASSQDEAGYVSQLLRGLWMQANAQGVGTWGGAAASATVPNATASGARGAVAYTPPSSMLGSPLPTPAATFQSRRGGLVLKLCGGIAAAALLLGGSWYGFSQYWGRSGTGAGLDLSAMSIEDIAQMEANPAVANDVQAGIQAKMVEALGFGRDAGSAKAAAMEEDHINALKSMGLVMGSSMKNAMGCLAK